MIFQWSRETATWDLVADSGELLGTATAIPGDCWAAKMTDVGGGHEAWATDLETIKEWMTEEAAAVR
jgi:hypothetical protein